MSTTDEYCIVCGQDGPLKHAQKATEFDVRGETLSLQVPVTVCPSCGTTEVERGIDPAKMAFAEYRERKGLLTPERIRAIRKRYKLSQKSLAALLGMSEATINRYERGGLQDAAHDAAIRACENPDFVQDLLDRRGDKLSAWQRQRVEDALKGQTKTRYRLAAVMGQLWNMPQELSLVTGFRKFTYEKYAAVVAWFCRRLKRVTPTSLNKLLFYADFLHFRSESVSLTGAAYRRLPYGPVPADFGGLREQMEIDQVVEVREVEYQNGNVGEEYRVGPKADELDVTFSPRELAILDAITRAFDNVTPSEISNRSHKESAWRDTEDRTLISYDKASDLSLPVPE
jgi:putative zinc finger/helix-turn-helix YgiT family protein